MKKIVVDKIMKSIDEKYHYDKVKTAEIKYGIESIYLFFTKTIVIILLAFIFNVLQELLLLLIFYSIIRATGFGVHAKKSWHCWVSSLLIFLGTPILSTQVIIPQYISMLICLLCIILIAIYAPADTEKRPIINKKRRLTYKILCTLTTLTYSIIVLFMTNSILSNIILCSMIIEVFMIIPISYRLFNVKYNNYKIYLQNHLSHQ